MTYKLVLTVFSFVLALHSFVLAITEYITLIKNANKKFVKKWDLVSKFYYQEIQWCDQNLILMFGF
jgi:hypothetical protein